MRAPPNVEPLSATSRPRIDVAVCTFQRPHLRRTLLSIADQSGLDLFDVRLIVVDNDRTPSAKRLTDELRERVSLPVLYRHAPHQNISLARNAALTASDADYLAFVDDDEIASRQWLKKAYAAIQRSQCDAVFGPVVALYPGETPDWIVENDFHSTRVERKRAAVDYGYAGNVLMRRRCSRWRDQRFDEALGRSGGEDTDYFERLRRLGANFDATEDAMVFETPARRRLTLSWLLGRRYRSGLAHRRALAGGGFASALASVIISGGKALFCCAALALSVADRKSAAFWLLRGVFHVGVFVESFPRMAPARLMRPKIGSRRSATLRSSSAKWI